MKPTDACTQQSILSAAMTREVPSSQLIAPHIRAICSLRAPLQFPQRKQLLSPSSETYRIRDVVIIEMMNKPAHFNRTNPPFLIERVDFPGDTDKKQEEELYPSPTTPSTADRSRSNSDARTEDSRPPVERRLFFQGVSQKGPRSVGRPLLQEFSIKKAEQKDKFWLRRFRTYMKGQLDMLWGDFQHQPHRLVFWDWYLSTAGEPNNHSEYRSYDRTYKAHLFAGPNFQLYFNEWFYEHGQKEVVKAYPEVPEMRDQFYDYAENELSGVEDIALGTPKSPMSVDDYEEVLRSEEDDVPF